MKNFLRYILPVLAWSGVIFSLSTNTGSASHTNAFLDSFLTRYFPGWYRTLTEPERDALHFYVRKAAHVTEYAVLGILALRALRGMLCVRPRRLAVAAWTFATAFAATDELHQVFVPGRTAKATDVLIDSCGAAAGIALLIFAATRKDGYETGS